MMAADMMPQPLIDVDCNLFHRDLKSLQNKNEGSPWSILEEDAIEAANICGMLSPASTIEEAKHGLDILKNNPPPLPVRTTVGVHPYHVNDDEFKGKSMEDCEQTIKDLFGSHRDLCAAVGECGLDASEGFPPLEAQIPWFRLQVKIAEELKLPLFVHERLAFDETLEILADVSVPVVIHCFTGTKKQCEEYIKRGFHISISGYILKESNDNCAEVISCLTEGTIPVGRLMIETDAPYMGFSSSRQLYIEHNKEYVEGLNSKKRKRLKQSIYPNVPSSLVGVLDKVVMCLNENDSTITRDQVAKQTTENARRLFGF
jgi:TatD DNase family protein